MGHALHLTPEDALAYLETHIVQMQSQAQGKRIAIGIVGGPGVGKSTLAAELTQRLNAEHPGTAALVPMDGFHMKHAKIVELGFEERKGAPHTFEGAEFVRFLARLKGASEAVEGPGYSRVIEDTVDGEFTVAGDVQTLIVEGNYLLLPDAPWDGAKPLLDYAVFIHVDEALVEARLMKRHGEHGHFTAERNKAHIERNDMPNYRLVETSKDRADLVINLDVTA